MSLLAAFLLVRAAKDVIDVSRSVAATAQTAAAAAQIASSVATIKRENAERAAANAAACTSQATQAKPQSTISAYDLDLFYAKVAMLSYIAKADNLITQEEKTELDQTLNVAANMYGYEAVARARNIFDNEVSSFLTLEPYLQKIQERDLDSFLFYSEEYAKTDKKMTSEEAAAIQKLRSYIEARKGKKSFHNLSCPSCGAAMKPDAYGYKASCGYCGYEVVMNIDNNPNKVGAIAKCTSCGATFNQFRNSNNFMFCTYCGGRVVNVTESTTATRNVSNSGMGGHSQDSSNVYISFNTINPSIGMVTRIVSTGMKSTFVNGQTMSFRLNQGPQTIILKIGKKNYSRDIVIPPDNSPVRIYASFNGRAQIIIDQPPVY